MAEIQVFKTKITNACALLKSHEPEVSKLDQSLRIPTNGEQSTHAAKQFHDSYVIKAIETINARTEHKEREKLMLDLNKHLEAESNSLEISVIQWLTRIDFRKEELLQQTALLTTSQAANSQSLNSGASNVTFYHVPTHENIADCAKKSDQERSSSSPLVVRTSGRVQCAVWPLEKTNDYSKLVRITAYCARFIRKATKGKLLALGETTSSTATPSTEEIILAELLLIRQEQAIHKSALLMQNKQLNMNIDDNGIFRKYGRLQNADISFDTANIPHTKAKQIRIFDRSSVTQAVITLYLAITAGVPLKILSDNGTNFRLTATLLSQSPNTDEDLHLSLFLSEHGIKWNFIPP
ncbi:hypothetical protein COOONC_01341 [Cooperia oncophora]